MSKAFKRLLKSAVYSAAFVGFAAPAMAQLTPAQQQAVDTQTGIASPDRSLDRLGEEEFTPRVTPRVEVKKMQVQGAPAGAENYKFELGGIVMDGATVYPEGALRAVYADKIGTTISLADLYGIAADVTRMYRNDGYILTQVVVPPQTIDGGIAKLQVVEGFIDKIEVRGEGQASLRLVREYAQHIKKSGAMNTLDLERALLLINDLAGVDARAVLNPSPSTMGAADMLIIVDRKPYDAQIGIDNFGTRYLGPLQLSTAASLNSWLGRNERITGQFVMAPDFDHYHELLYGSLAYEQPVWTLGTMASLTASHTHTTPGYALDQFDVRGWSSQLTAQLEHPFIRSRAMNLDGRVLLDFLEVTTKNNIPVDPTRKDHIRALRFGGTFETLDNFLGLAYNVADVEFSRGLDLFGANDQDDLDMSRPDADITFFKMNLDLQRLQRVTDNINLLLGFTGQWAKDSLLSSEEFGVGGQIYGRGYDPSEAIGEEGIAGKIEAQWTEPYDLSMFETYQLYGFYDAGRVWNQDATTDSLKKETLTSTGLGIRADFNEMTTAGLMMAFPLNNTPQTQGDRDPRFYVNLNRRF